MSGLDSLISSTSLDSLSLLSLVTNYALRSMADVLRHSINPVQPSNLQMRLFEKILFHLLWAPCRDLGGEGLSMAFQFVASEVMFEGL